MTKLKWNNVGERFFEAGVDRGVLYLKGQNGVPWNGLISVSESPSGGEITPYHIDGINYLNHVANEEFRATIEAYTYPDEFARCDGTSLVTNGLFVTQQPKESFGLSYTTKVGNDVDGVEYAYKIHIVYNATATPTNRSNNTLTQLVDPDNFIWEIFTKPPLFTGYKPTAHFVIDSREVPELLMQQIQDILYGSSESEPRLPSADELIFIFENYSSLFADAGRLTHTYFSTIDAGHIPEEQTDTLEGGSP